MPTLVIAHTGMLKKTAQRKHAIRTSEFTRPKAAWILLYPVDLAVRGYTSTINKTILLIPLYNLPGCSQQTSWWTSEIFTGSLLIALRFYYRWHRAFMTVIYSNQIISNNKLLFTSINFDLILPGTACIWWYTTKSCSKDSSAVLYVWSIFGWPRSTFGVFLKCRRARRLFDLTGHR